MIIMIIAIITTVTSIITAITIRLTLVLMMMACLGGNFFHSTTSDESDFINNGEVVIPDSVYMAMGTLGNVIIAIQKATSGL